MSGQAIVGFPSDIARQLVQQADEAELAAARLPVQEDPYARPVLPADHGQGPVPQYTPEEVAELLRLISPLRLQGEDGRWREVPMDLNYLRWLRRDWLDEQQRRVDDVWRNTAAYRRMVAEQQHQAAEAREDREYEQSRVRGREQLAARRFLELRELGLSVPAAREHVGREFPGVDW